MRYAIILSSLLLGAALPATAQVTITFGVPSQSIGINNSYYPDFQRVPSYPVYYAPQANSNLFFYDGMYWAYQRDNWYTSSWYNGPWRKVSRKHVPNYILRVPVRYYRRPPQYFRGWSYDEPPRWGQYYGAQWEQERSGWNTWIVSSAPPPAPLPVYQRQYSGDRYPQYEQQPVIRSEYYHYQPSEPVVRQYYEQEKVQVKQHAQPQQAPPPQQQRSQPPQQQQPQQPTHSEPQQQAKPQPQPQPQQQPHGQSQEQHGQQQPQPQQQPHGQSQEQHGQQPQGARGGEAQVPASDQQDSAPQGKDKDKGSKSGQGQDDGTDKGEGNGQDKSQEHSG